MPGSRKARKVQKTLSLQDPQLLWQPEYYPAAFNPP